jgi:4a-hydroxytetrahydrobiopterin dehydratase
MWLNVAMPANSISPAQFDVLDDLDDWRVVLDGLITTYRCGSFPAAAHLATAIAEAAELANHHPDLDIRYPDVVRVVLTTHDIDGLSDLDVALARTISGIAGDLGAAAEPHAGQVVEIAIDTVDADRIRPFWAAVLGYRERDGALVDPRRVGPPVWFQQMDEPRTDRDRFHIDVNVPHDCAEERIAAALAAGGRLVSDDFARRWWVLADADGNEACVCTWQDREDP